MSNRDPVDDQSNALRFDWRQRTTLAMLSVTSFVVIFNAAALPIPLPSIMEDFGATLDEMTWVFAAFVIVFAVLLLPCARLGDRYGRRRLFLTGAVVIVLASVTCALALSLGALIAAQAVLGAGAAMVEPAIYATITATIPPPLQSRAFRLQTVGVFAGAGLGPVLSGLVTTGLSWEFVFWLDALLATVALIGAWWILPESHNPHHRPRRSALATAAGSIGVVALMAGIIEGARLGWGDSWVIVSLFAVSAIAVLLFVTIQARSRKRLVDSALFQHRRFIVGNVARALTEFTSLAIFFALSHFLQVQLGYSALAAGTLLMVIIAATITTAPIASAFNGRVDVRWLILPGFALVAAATFWTAHVSPETHWTFFIAPLALFGAGIGALEEPAQNATHADLPSEAKEPGWRVAYVTYLLGIALGVAVVSAVWQTYLVANLPARSFSQGIPGDVGEPAIFAAAVNTALLSCVIAAALGLLIAVFLSPTSREKTISQNVYTPHD